MASFAGVVTGDIIEARFAYSGKVVSVRKKAGDDIKKWETIASLDRKLLQAELDRQLSDYEKVRAEFEIFNLKQGQSEGDITKFLRQEKQASLNASVKDVEIAKYRLDQADLLSPVNGFILSMEGLVAGLNITPASSAVKILNGETLNFTFEVNQKNLIKFLSSTRVRVLIPGQSHEYVGMTLPPVSGKDGRFDISVVLEDRTGLIFGMKGNAHIV